VSDASENLEQQQDIAAEGFRVFHFSVNEEEVMASVFETVQLFLEPEILPGVTRAAAQRNIKFLRDYMPAWRWVGTS
jgi:hypothetical protein